MTDETFRSNESVRLLHHRMLNHARSLKNLLSTTSKYGGIDQEIQKLQELSNRIKVLRTSINGKPPPDSLIVESSEPLLEDEGDG